MHPADQRACIVAVWSEHFGKWLFAKSYSCLFGIGSVVVSFNRLPALATAVSKRLGICMCAAYFDDLITLEPLIFRASARRFLLLVVTALGTPCLAQRCAQFGDTWKRPVLLPPAKRILCHVVSAAIKAEFLTSATARTSGVLLVCSHT